MCVGPVSGSGVSFRLFSSLSSLALNAGKDGASATSRGSRFQLLRDLGMKLSSLMVLIFSYGSRGAESLR